METKNTNGMRRFTIPFAAEKILSLLNGAGYEAFLVGGCVRDLLRGVTPNDYDMTTSATPDEMRRVFADYRTIETGIRHGTLTVLMDGAPYEITTYRVDGAYADNRHPTEVRFTANLREDAARRDFTVNAMAYHPALGVQDFFGGQDDLAARRLRAVGDPRGRFEEDALRILRALRFAATLGYSIEKETADAAREKAPLLKNISAERVREELTKLLLGENAATILTDFADILATVLPKWQRYTSADEKNILTPLAAWLAASPAQPVARYTVFFSLLPPAEAQAEMDGLRFDHRTRDRVVKLLSHLNAPCGKTADTARPFLAGRGEQDALLLLDLRIAACRARGAESMEEEAAKAAVAALLAEEGECSSVADLAVGGRDLLALGLAAGKPLGLALRTLLAAVVAGETKNEKQALLAYVKKHILTANSKGDKE